MFLAVCLSGVLVVLILLRQCHMIIISEGLTLLKISNTHLSLMVTILRRAPQEAALVLGSTDRQLRGHHLIAVDMIITDKEAAM